MSDAAKNRMRLKLFLRLVLVLSSDNGADILTYLLLLIAMRNDSKYCKPTLKLLRQYYSTTLHGLKF